MLHYFLYILNDNLIFNFKAELKIMEEIKVKQQLTNEITKTCLNIKEEMIEQNELPSKQKNVEKVCYIFKNNNIHSNNICF